mmetsp:Transcript_22804/g.64088  ORF Transcript_22804/g.64088 Transcript_22804/m.64088 type:complete len:260 (+) Transcript_22804:1066-1845(+)
MTQVVAALALEVRDRVDICDALYQLPLDVAVLTVADQVIRGHAQLALETGRLDDELAGLLLDGDELADVLALELCPGDVQCDECRGELGPRGPRGTVVLLDLQLAAWGGTLPTVEQPDQLHPGLLEGLRVAHGLGAELEFVAVDPDLGMLIQARLQDVHAIEPRVVREERPVVCREAPAVRTRGAGQAHAASRPIDVRQEGRASRVPGLAAYIGDPVVQDQLPVACTQPLDGRSLGCVQRAPGIGAEPAQHASAHFWMG